MSKEGLAIQGSLENKGIQDIQVDQEKLVLRDGQVEMVLMEMQLSALSVRVPIPEKEKLATQVDQENLDLLDL